MAGYREPVLFEDIFEIKDVNPDGPKFDKGKLNTHKAVSHYRALLL